MTHEASEKLNENLSKLEALSKRLIQVMASRKGHNPALDAPSPQLFADAAHAWWAEAMNNPARLIESQMSLWSQTVTNFIDAQQAFIPGKEAEVPKDRRFANPLWDSNPYFHYAKQQYLTNAQVIRQAAADARGLEPKEHQRLVYFTDQIINMMAPTNFLATNPDALEHAVETEGASLVAGLENLIADLEANDGELLVRLADENAFELGCNIATTPGGVVFRNRMMELIQYDAVTEKVYQTPLVIFPPWINKFYILDLKAQNSLIKWLTEQGYTVFVVSWVNPDPSYAHVGMEDYIEDGYLAAIEAVKAICDTRQVNAVGYCIAGTTLSLVLSLLKQRSDQSVKSATLFTALTDFADQGEFTPFLQDDFIDGIEAECAEKGILSSVIMARTFSFLRSNDLIYGPAIKSYMMGKAPPAFDLLYWNGDGANLPAKMAMQYLRGLCQRNEFACDGFELMGHTLKLSEVDLPLCAVTCETDHIAAWRQCYLGVQQMGSEDKTFILGESGHIAGIVNPPSKGKYGHYLNADTTLAAEDWQAGASFHKGSWWRYWDKWLQKHSGKKIPARETGKKSHPVLAKAPGTYVTHRASG